MPSDKAAALPHRRPELSRLKIGCPAIMPRAAWRPRTRPQHWRRKQPMFSHLFTKRFWLDLYAEINDDNVFNGAAALGYYLTLAIFPALIVMMALIPYLPIQDVDQAIMDLLGQALPDESAAMVEGIVVEVTQQQRGGLLSFGLLATLWAASAGIYAIMQQLNITYDVKEERSFVVARATAIILSIVVGAMIVGAFALVVLGGVIEDWIGNTLGYSEALVIAFRVFRWIVIVLALLLVFALLYRYAPNVEQRFAFITPGSVLGVVLLIAASLAFSIYIDNFGDYDATYGSIGAVIILMLWLYILGLVLLVGSEINALVEHYSAHGKRKGEKKEGDRPGGSLRDEPEHDHEPRRQPRRGRPSLGTLGLAAVVAALTSRSSRGRSNRGAEPAGRNGRVPGE
jgi:membrane protein